MKTWVKSLMGVVIFLAILSYFVFIYPRGDWQKEYRSRVNMGEYAYYTGTSSDFNYNEDNIQEVIDYLLSISNNEEEYTRNVGEWVYYNIRYDFTLVEDPVVLEKHCMDNSASDIITIKRGVCVTQTKVAIALLRGGGVMARPVNGCIRSVTCEPLEESFGAFQIFEDENKKFRQPIIAPIKEVNGRYPIAGGLHSWVEVYLLDYEWVILEPTTGLMYRLNCQDLWKSYDILTTLDLCHVNDAGFVNECRVF